jgi:hypothetical protein
LWHKIEECTRMGLQVQGIIAGAVAAIAHLEALRAKEGRFLFSPSAVFWWLEHCWDSANTLMPATGVSGRMKAV